MRCNEWCVLFAPRANSEGSRVDSGTSLSLLWVFLSRQSAKMPRLRSVLLDEKKSATRSFRTPLNGTRRRTACSRKGSGSWEYVPLTAQRRWKTSIRLAILRGRVQENRNCASPSFQCCNTISYRGVISGETIPANCSGMLAQADSNSVSISSTPTASNLMASP